MNYSAQYHVVPATFHVITWKVDYLWDSVHSSTNTHTHSHTCHQRLINGGHRKMVVVGTAGPDGCCNYIVVLCAVRKQGGTVTETTCTCFTSLLLTQIEKQCLSLLLTSRWRKAKGKEKKRKNLRKLKEKIEKTCSFCTVIYLSMLQIRCSIYHTKTLLYCQKHRNM